MYNEQWFFKQLTFYVIIIKIDYMIINIHIFIYRVAFDFCVK